MSRIGSKRSSINDIIRFLKHWKENKRIGVSLPTKVEQGSYVGKYITNS